MLANMDNSQQIIKGKRLNSLDFFRGATVAAMIWVNMIQITVKSDVMSLKGFLYSEVLKGIFTLALTIYLPK